MKKENVFFDMQRTFMDRDPAKKERDKIHASWFDESTVDFWRHRRMYEMAGPVASFYKDNKWLTIGDGRYGLDSVRLRKLFSIQDILPTDISSTMLRIGKEKGLFEEYSVENAEKLSFEDDSFDVVFCKESYHHFPRPILALYEMIRVSRSAIILIEPVDYVTYSINKKEYVLSFFKLIYSLLSRKSAIPHIANITPVPHDFEASGNYVYPVSLREVEKIIHGMDLGGMAWLGFNDCYQKGCEFEQAVAGNPVFEHIKKSIERADRNCNNYPSYYKHDLAAIVIFKDSVDRKLRETMEKFGYHFATKTNNPVFENTA